MHGYGLPEVLGAHFSDFVAPGDREKIVEHLSKEDSKNTAQPADRLSTSA